MPPLNDDGGGGKSVVELSINETQALRAKLGLPPLRLPSSSSSSSLSSSSGGGGGGAADHPPPSLSSSSGGFVHAPAPDTSKADEVRRRLEDASARREALNLINLS